MNRRERRRQGIMAIVGLLAAIMGLLVLIAFICVKADAKVKEPPEPTITSICRKIPEPEGEWWNGGHLYIVKRDKNGHAVVQLGWVKWKGNLYYCHKTASGKYPFGSATRGEIRDMGGNHWVAFDEKGRRIVKDTYVSRGPHRKVKSLELNKKGYVTHIYNTTACHRGSRYSTEEHRRQELTNDRWVSVGQQYYPDYVDGQK